MIVIVGSPAWRSAVPPGPAGRACGIALAAAARGARVELVGRVGEDAAGEALLIALARSGVGHATVLRDPTRPTLVVDPPPAAPDDDGSSPVGEPVPSRRAAATTASSAGARLEGADVDLAVRYLEPSGVLVVTEDAPAEALAAAVSAAGYAQMQLVVLLPPVREAPGAVPAGLPEDATVLSVPSPDEGDAGAFEAIVAAYAATLDAGAPPAEAFAAAQGATGWETSPAD